MKFKKGFKQYIIGVISFCTLLLIIYKLQQFRLNKLIDDGIYTIGYGDKTMPKRTGTSYSLSYLYQNQEYKLTLGMANNELQLKNYNRYFVIFEKDDPENAMLLPFLIVPDSITEAPPEGWKELPVPVDNEEIRNFLENY